MQGSGMRVQGSGTPPGVFHTCAVRGCIGLAWPGEDNCRECAEEIEMLEALRGGQVPSAAAADDGDAMGGARGAAGRLEGFCYACGSAAVMLYLLWATRSFWIAWADILFGFFGWLFGPGGGDQ